MRYSKIALFAVTTMARLRGRQSHEAQYYAEVIQSICFGAQATKEHPEIRSIQ